MHDKSKDFLYGKGWLDLKLDNFCSFLTLIAGALRGCARLYEAERGFAWR